MSRLPGGIDSEVPHEQDEEISLCLETLTVDIGEPLAMQQHTNGEARSDVQEAEIVPDRSILIADSEDDVRLPDKEDSRYHPELTGMEGVQQEYDLGCSAEMIVYHTDQKSKVTTRAHELEELRRRNLASQNAVKINSTYSRVSTDITTFQRRQRRLNEEIREHEKLAMDGLHAYRSDDQYFLELMKRLGRTKRYRNRDDSWPDLYNTMIDSSSIEKPLLMEYFQCSSRALHRSKTEAEKKDETTTNSPAEKSHIDTDETYTDVFELKGTFGDSQDAVDEDASSRSTFEKSVTNLQMATSRCRATKSTTVEEKLPVALKRVPLYIRKPSVGIQSAPLSCGQVITCTSKYIPNLHLKRGACERCLYWATTEEKARFVETGHHLRIMMVRGGCSKDCAVFPRQPDEHPVRLCKRCFYDTHRLSNQFCSQAELRLLWSNSCAENHPRYSR